ncbi:unnamed protein product, partial [Rotaria sordida]
MTTKRFGQWATRLYIILLIIGLIILALYTIVQPQTLTKNFEKPSLNLYNELQQDHGDTLKCSCSVIASTYNQFITIKPIFHEICSSPFVSSELRTNFTVGLIPDLSAYTQKDYRRFLSAHLQFLAGLCELSIQSVNDSINQFLTSLFVTTQVLPEMDFAKHLTSQIEQRKSIAPITFTRLHNLIRNINHGNRIISTYGTNFDYVIPWRTIGYTYAVTQAIIYDNGFSSTITTIKINKNTTTTTSTTMTTSTNTIRNNTSPQGIIVADFNNDTNFDIAVANYHANNFLMWLGNGDRSFSVPIIFSTGRNSYPRAIVTADFNRDGHVDIAVVNHYGKNIGISLGNGNGAFELQQISFTGGFYLPIFLAVGDFNEDRIPDVVFSYYYYDVAGVLFGY